MVVGWLLAGRPGRREILDFPVFSPFSPRERTASRTAGKFQYRTPRSRAAKPLPRDFSEENVFWTLLFAVSGLTEKSPDRSVGWLFG